jgi:hypothetical protein
LLREVRQDNKGESYLLGERPVPPDKQGKRGHRVGHRFWEGNLKKKKKMHVSSFIKVPKNA